MDEVDYPPSSANLGALLKIITERLSRRDCNRVQFNLAGQLSVVDNLRESHESSLRILTMLNLQPLGIDEQREVILRGMNLTNEESSQAISICDDSIDRLGGLSEGYPHFLQQYAYSAFESDCDNCITVEDVVDGAYSENGAIWRIGERYFDAMYFKNINSEQYRKVLRYLAQFGDSWVSRRDIVSSSGVSGTTATNALQALKQRNIIISDNRRRGYYRLPTRSFAVWISTMANADSSGS